MHRGAVVVSLLAFAVLIFSIRQHLIVFSDFVYTYTFFPGLHLNPIDYPANRLDASQKLVPETIHQIRLDPAPAFDEKYALPLSASSDFARALDDLSERAGLSSHFPPPSATSNETTCQQLHPKWNHYMWTDGPSLAFINEHYPSILPHYLKYKQTIQRANILRYLLLHHYGGVYLDTDIACLHPLDELLVLPWLTPGAHPTGINNAFILAKPQHPFLDWIIRSGRVETRDLAWGLPYVENMFSTGCLFISAAYTKYWRHHGYMHEYSGLSKAKSRFDNVHGPQSGGELFILDGEKHWLRGAVRTPLFEHFGKSSWHSWDAGLILLISKSLKWVAIGAAFIFVFGIWLVLRRRRLVGRRRSWTEKVEA